MISGSRACGNVQFEVQGELMGVSFCDQANESERDHEVDVSVARSVRNGMLGFGVLAICELEPTVKMYPALTMDQQILLQGVDIMGPAIDIVDRKVKGGENFVGDDPAIPSGVVGF